MKNLVLSLVDGTERKFYDLRPFKDDDLFWFGEDGSFWIEHRGGRSRVFLHNVVYYTIEEVDWNEVTRANP